MFLSFVTAALFLLSGFLILNIHPRDFEAIFSANRERKQRVRQLSGKKGARLSSTLSEAQQMLDEAGMGESMSMYRLMAVVLFFGGFTAGMAMNSIFIAAVLAVGCAAIPLIIIRFRTSNYLRELSENVQISMSLVTSSYMANPDLIAAVEDNIALIPAPLNGVFERFLVSTRLIDSSVTKALMAMQDEVNNAYWRDWCGVLMQCQDDRTMRYALSGLVERLGDVHRIRMEIESTLRKQISDYILTVLVVIASVPIMCAMVPDWSEALFGTLAGRITLGIMLAVILATSVWISRLFRPMDGREGSHK